MFDLSWSHILIVLIVALVVVGPKDLPKIMRTAGRWMGKARAMADQFRKSFDEMARQSELDELRAEIQALRTHRPLAEIEQSVNRSILPPDPLAEPPHAGAQQHLVDVPDPAATPHATVPETPHP
ncbi:MAG: Sec-independent protein translocase protein TatB [Rhizomicrobium sp.]|jgi:sec-independent protein translocase protein TatB